MSETDVLTETDTSTDHLQQDTGVVSDELVDPLLAQDKPAKGKKKNPISKVRKKLAGKPKVSTPKTKATDKFDKAVEGSNWSDAFALLRKLPGGTQSAKWGGLSKAQRTSFLAALDHATAKKAKATMQRVFDATPDDELKNLEKCMELRFHIKVGQAQGKNDEGMDFDAAGLRRCYMLLDKLPPKHVQGNKWLEHWTRYKADGSSGSGYYSAYRKESAIGYDKDKMDSANKAADPGDPLYDVIRFNKVVRHEVGHAVDKKLNGSDTYCTTKDGGSWKTHGAADLSLVEEMAKASGGPLSKWKNAGQQASMYQAILDALSARQPKKAKKNVRKLAFWKGPDAPSDDEKSGVLGDDIFRAIETNGPGKNPWYRAANGGVALDGRVYQESYAKRWTSYDASVRAKKVSQYQFRAPGEWFAEVYATYYEVPTGKKPGDLLKGTDSKSKKWFDKHVHTK